MNRTRVDSVIKELALLKRDSHLTSHMNDQIQILERELRFLRTYIWLSAKWNGACLNSPWETNIKATLKKARKGLKRIGISALYRREFKDWDLSVSQWLKTIEHCKPTIRHNCLYLIDYEFQTEFYSNFELLELIEAALVTLKDLLCLGADLIVSVKIQFGDLEEKLSLFRDLFDFTAKRCVSHKEFRDFKIHLRDWAYNVVCLLILYWINRKEEEMAPRMNIALSDLLRKIKRCTPEIVGMYLGVLKASKSSRSDTSQMTGLVSRFVGFLLENSEVLLKDGIRNLHEGLTFLITFLMDPPQEQKEDGKLILRKAEAAIDYAPSVICSLCASELKEGTPEEKNVLLLDFLEMIHTMKKETREAYVGIKDSLWSKFPTTNGFGFINFLLGNLKDFLECKSDSIFLVKHQLLAIQENLMSLRCIIKDISDFLENEHDKLQHVWVQIMNVSYQVEHAIDSCLFTEDPFWYKLILLSDVLGKLKLIIVNLKKTRDEQISSASISVGMDPSDIVSARTHSTRFDEVVVGLKEEANAIIGQLTRGSKQLDIVAIVGMPGIGKTTLARKVYSDPSVQYHFNKCAWCSVSQTYRMRELLHDILSDVTVVSEQVFGVREEDLAEKLYKCLKGQRYLIVVDDIWDIRAWNRLRESLPNDSNGSRIILTTRVHDVALRAKPDCNLHLLHPLSNEESWQLLQKKLFQYNGCPPHLSEIGKQIAKSCKGLPLAVVLITGLLARRVTDVDWWEQIARNTTAHIASEGCMDILELSYKHLPDYLKPCFLYFGAFREDGIVKVQKLIQLWISEGFVQTTGTKSLEDVANDFLMDLISRNLINVLKWSSNGGIKACSIHDLLHDLCLAKIKEERFLKLLNGFQCSSGSMKFKQYRLCVRSKWGLFVKSKVVAPFLRSMLFPQNSYWNPHPNAPDFFLRFKFLRVLDLEGVQIVEHFPQEILQLVHLRYLAVWVNVRPIPSSIDNLHKLEVLNVKNSFLKFDLPCSIWNMKKLRHLSVRRGAAVSLGQYEHEESAQLDNLQSFSMPFLCYGEDAEKFLRRLPNIRKLRCQISESRDCCWEHNQFSVLEFPSKLESLNMAYDGKVLHPIGFSFPSTLKKLTLAKFCLPWTEISAIGKLPNLEVLKIKSNAFQGRRWDVEDEQFLKLKFLKLDRLNIAEWTSSTDPFPCLEQLVLEECYELEDIPLGFGDISTLNSIEVRSCSCKAESSARQILIEQLDMGNEGLEVHIISPEDFLTHSLKPFMPDS